MHGTYEKTSAGDGFNVTPDGGVKKATNVISGGGPSNASGPTTSSRTYPKGSSVSTDSGRLNPRNEKATDIYVGGVGSSGGGGGGRVVDTDMDKM